MDDELAALAAQHAQLANLLDGVDEAGWSAASRCPGWTVSDVLLHLAQTDEMAVASLDDRLPAYLDDAAKAWAEGAAVGNVDDGAGLMVAAEREHLTPDEIHDRWLTGSAAVRARLAERGPSDRVQWVAGQLSVRTLAVTRLSECWIHSEDIADGIGAELAPTERLRHIARLAWRTLPYAFARSGEEPPGRVAFELEGPDGERWTIDDEGSPAPTVLTGTALDLCRVAGQRADATDTSVKATGPDAERVVALVRTFA